MKRRGLEEGFIVSGGCFSQQNLIEGRSIPQGEFAGEENALRISHYSCNQKSWFLEHLSWL